MTKASTYGTVYDSNTAEPIAPATEAELRASLTSGTVEGHFDRDGRTCYVLGEDWGAMEAILADVDADLAEQVRENR